MPKKFIIKKLKKKSIHKHLRPTAFLLLFSTVCTYFSVWINSFKKTSCCSSVNYLNENVVLSCDVGKNVSMDTFISFQHYSNGTLKDLKENRNKFFYSSIDKSYYRSVRNLTIYNVTENDTNEYFCVVFNIDIFSELAREKFILSNLTERKGKIIFVQTFVLFLLFIFLEFSILLR